MAIRIRSTESHPHPIWDKLKEEYKISEIQGFIISATDNELITSTKLGVRNIPIICLEAAEYDEDSEFIPTNFFSNEEWVNKLNTSKYFNSPLLFLTHKTDDPYLFRLYKVQDKEDCISFEELHIFQDEKYFIDWWKTIKKLSQSKNTTEARVRQDKTIFDNVIERNNYSWGGNIDGFILTHDNGDVLAVIEVRYSRSYNISDYDPAKFYLGTKNKGGDFKTWLPLVYLKKAYNLPIILITFSTKSGGKFGYTEVFSLNEKKLFYVNDISPTNNVTENFLTFQNWLEEIISRK